MNIDQKEKVAKRRTFKADRDQSLNAQELKYKPPKNWKHMYTRSEKMKRASKLGFEYPRLSKQQLQNLED